MESQSIDITRSLLDFGNRVKDMRFMLHTIGYYLDDKAKDKREVTAYGTTTSMSDSKARIYSAMCNILLRDMGKLYREIHVCSNTSINE